MSKLPRLLVAAPASGGGKTTLTFGLMGALVERGLDVQGFKCGPDYIDPGHHANVTGRPSHNLDTWMLGREACRDLFCHYAERCDLAVIEGVMGLFDGKGDGLHDPREALRGSSADVALLLQVPVLLVVDVRAQAASAAATVLGFRDLLPGLNLAGVILNRVGSERHAAMAREAIEGCTGVPVLGALPRTEAVLVPERHLGLVTAAEDVGRAYRAARELVSQHVDVEAVWRLAQGAPALPHGASTVFRTGRGGQGCRVAIARDEAFSFQYAANIDLMTAMGAEVRFFSPLRDEAVPAESALLYLCGGYPELHAETLGRAERFRQSVLAHVQAGGAIYGECGGLMVLGESVLDLDNRRWPMLGLLPLNTTMTGRRLSLGYVEAAASRESLLAPAGAQWRGHEFHYSEVHLAEDLPACWQLRKSLETGAAADGWQRGRVLAGYLHTHFAACPALLQRLLTRAREAG